MKKKEFLKKLRKGLKNLSKNDRNEQLTFYAEMIDDRMEEGMSEEEAVSKGGNVEEIVKGILLETPVEKQGIMKFKGRKSAWEIALLVLGSPVWISVLAAVFSAIVSMYAAVWAVVVSLWAVLIALWACTLALGIAAVYYAASGFGLTGISAVCAALVCAGLSVFFLYGCKSATKHLLAISGKFLRRVKRLLTGKEETR